MMKIGLTGGIGAGKTTVCQMFIQLGVPTVDADKIAKQLVEPEQPALIQIKQAFGSRFIQDGQLDRVALASLVFQDPLAKKTLESILHPMIQEEVLSQVEKMDAPYCIIDIPLLSENKEQYDWVDRIIVVDAPVPTQQARVHQRDGRDVQEIRAIIQSQTNRDRRLTIADEVIDNSGSLEQTQDQVGKLHQKFIKMASN